MKTNLQFFLNSYNDLVPTTTPSLNLFKWNRQINGVSFAGGSDLQVQVPVYPGATSEMVPFPYSTSLYSANATTNSTTTLVTASAPTGVVAGNLIVAPGVPVNTTVVSITGNTIIMSQAATASATVQTNMYAPAGFVYIESDQQALVIYNGVNTLALNPFKTNGVTQPAVFFLSGPIYSISIQNLSTTVANVYVSLMG